MTSPKNKKKKSKPKNYQVKIENIFGWGQEDQIPSKSSGFIICWNSNVGWGQLTFAIENNELRVDTESMSDEFVKQVLEALAKQALRVG